MTAARSGEQSVYSLMEALVGHPNITHDAQKELLSWALQVHARETRLHLIVLVVTYMCLEIFPDATKCHLDIVT